MIFGLFSFRHWLLFFLILLGAGILSAEEFTFDVSEIEKKPYDIGGFLELRPMLFGLDKDSAFYRLRYHDKDPGSVRDDYGLGLRLEGSYEKGVAGVFLRTDALLNYIEDDWSDDFKVLEGYLSFKPTHGFSINAGKRVIPWGKGYAFNPVAFVSRPKDADDPNEALEGYYVIDADFIKSFGGPLKTLALTPVLLPVTREINDGFGKPDHLNFAARLYLLLYDTDLDFMFFTGNSRTTRYGFDFSRNISTNFEIHGEFAWIRNTPKKSIDPSGNLFLKTEDGFQTLLGIRYLTANDITVYLEYYHNDAGIKANDAENFYGFVDDAYNHFLATGDNVPLTRATQLSRGTLTAPRPMRDYLYFRASIKEPFDILYFTPAITTIINLNDESLSLSPELAYSPVTNLDLRLRGMFLVGSGKTEFGEKQYDYRVELRIRYFF